MDELPKCWVLSLTLCPPGVALQFLVGAGEKGNRGLPDPERPPVGI